MFEDKYNSFENLFTLVSGRTKMNSSSPYPYSYSFRPELIQIDPSIKSQITLPSISELFKDILVNDYSKDELRARCFSSNDLSPSINGTSPGCQTLDYIDIADIGTRYYAINKAISDKNGNPYKRRVRKSNYQTKVLERVFINNHFPDRKLREYLAKVLNLDQRNVQIWFQNKRQKLRMFS